MVFRVGGLVAEDLEAAQDHRPKEKDRDEPDAGWLDQSGQSDDDDGGKRQVAATRARVVQRGDGTRVMHRADGTRPAHTRPGFPAT